MSGFLSAQRAVTFMTSLKSYFHQQSICLLHLATANPVSEFFPYCFIIHFCIHKTCIFEEDTLLKKLGEACTFFSFIKV